MPTEETSVMKIYTTIRMSLIMHRFLALLFLILGSSFSIAQEFGETNRLDIRVVLSKHTYGNEPIYATVRMTNRSQESVSVLSMGGTIHAAMLAFDIKDENGNVQQIEARETTWFDATEPMDLEAGESINGEYNLSMTGKFEAGKKYHLVAVYYDCGSEGKTHRVISRPNSFVVENPEADTRERNSFIMDCLSFEGGPIGHEMWDADNDYFYLNMGFERRYLRSVKMYPEYPASKYLAYYLAKYYHRVGREEEAVPLLEFVSKQETFPLSDDAALLSFRCGAGKDVLVNLLEDYPDGNCAWIAGQLIEELQ